MRERRLFWQLFGAYSLGSLFVLVVVAVFATGAIRGAFLTHAGADLEARALLAREHLRGLPDSLIDNACKTLGAASGTRITVVDSRGKVVGDSHSDPSRMPNHADRAEVARALAGEVGRAVRASETVREQMMYVAVPVVEEGQVRLVVRTSLSYHALTNTIRSLERTVVGVALATVTFLALLSYGMAHRVKLSVGSLVASARAFASGDLTYPLARAQIAEIDELADALAQMASSLGERLATLTRERNERDAILASMGEGVLAVDSAARVVRMNEACGQILGVSLARAEGHPIEEAVRHSHLQAFVKQALASDVPIETEISLLGDEDRFVLAHGAALRDGEGRRVGAVVVVSDITKLKRLERVRRDFVANVSHELKTPIAAIQGAAETLREGALDSPADAKTFVEIIARQASRLHAVIRDLLTLSRVEEEEERAIALTVTPLQGIIDAALHTCSVKASEKRITVEVVGATATKVRADAPLLETAIVNLLDNAITYSEPGSTVTVRVSKNAEVVVEVEDHGCGIEPRHLARLFERFYRVDKARSRTLGGTGLGLAIVKHIAQAHGGRVSVDSTPGVGSTFRIHLPSAD